mgnify:CR=1 FL=1
MKNAVPTVMLCGVPAVVTTLAGAPAELVRLKLAPVPPPDRLAVTVYLPTEVITVKLGAVAIQLEFVDALPVAPLPTGPCDTLQGPCACTVSPHTGV